MAFMFPKNENLIDHILCCAFSHTNSSTGKRMFFGYLYMWSVPRSSRTPHVLHLVNKQWHTQTRVSFSHQQIENSACDKHFKLMRCLAFCVIYVYIVCVLQNSGLLL